MILKGIKDSYYQLDLLQLNEKPLGGIVDFYDLSYSPAFADIGELSFNLPKYTNDDSGNKVLNQIYERISEDMLIEVNGEHVFYIDRCLEKADKGHEYKDVHAYSREFELGRKRLVNYKVEGRFLYYIEPDGNNGFPFNDSTYPVGMVKYPTVDEDGYHTGLINEIERLTSWRFKRNPSTGYPIIPDELSKKTRGFDISDANLIEVLKQIQEAFSCIFIYNTKNREINIIEVDSLPDSGLMISDVNFIESITKDLQVSQAITRLYVYDKDGKGIGKKMAHGKDYIENYSYYMNDRFMSEHLISALEEYVSANNDYMAATADSWGLYDKATAERIETEIVILKLKESLIPYFATIDILTTKRDGGTNADGTIIPPGSLTSTEIAQLNNAQTEYDRINKKIKTLEEGYVYTTPRSLPAIDYDINRAKDELDKQSGKVDMESVFSDYEVTHSLPAGSLMDEMDSFIKTDTYTLDYSANLEEVYQMGIRALDKVSKPHLQFEVGDMVDFLQVAEYRNLSTAEKIKSLKTGANNRLYESQTNIPFDFNNGYGEIRLVRDELNSYYKVISNTEIDMSASFSNSQFAEYLEEMGEVTISLDIMIEADKTITLDGKKFEVDANEWTRIWVTKSFGENTTENKGVKKPYSRKTIRDKIIGTKLIENLQADVTSMYYRDLQVEKGDVATGWTLTPEEIERNVRRDSSNVLNNALKLGSYITIEHTELGFYEKALLLNYTHKPDSNSLSLKFSDNLNYFDEYTDISQLIARSSGTSSKVDLNTGVWGSGGHGAFENTNYLNQNIKAMSIEVVRLDADKIGTIELDAVNANIANLQAGKADIGELTAINASIMSLQVGKADIEELNAVKANIGTLQADYGDITTLLTGNLTAENFQANSITATSGVIANGAIVNAMIANLDAGKINAGRVNTSLVEVGSESGNLIIADNTIHISDNYNVTRVQIGKDASDDYNMYVWDADGNLMFDATGLHADGIKSEIIRDDMVAPNANISGSKLNISSVVEEINGGVTKIESANINYNGKSLNVAFGEMESYVDDLEGEIDSRVKITDFTIEQGKIAALISDVEVIEGDLGSTTSKVSALETTVDGISSSVSSLEADNDATKSGLSTLTQDVAGFKTTVQETYSTKGELSSAISTIDQTVGGVTTRVSDLETKTTNLEGDLAGEVDVRTSQFEVLSTGINSTVERIENLVIDAENRLYQSQTNIPFDLNVGTGTVQLFRNSPHPYYKVVSSTNIDLSASFPSNQFAEDLTGEDVVVSLDIMADVDSIIVLDGKEFDIKASRWTRIWVAKTLEENTTKNLRVRNPYSRKNTRDKITGAKLIENLIANTNIIYYRNLQVQKGYIMSNHTLTPEELEAQVERFGSEIKQLADSISFTVNKDNVISIINQSSEEVTIDASKIKLEGLTTINGDFKVYTDGSIFARNAEIGGTINAIDGSIGTMNIYDGMLEQSVFEYNPHGNIGYNVSFGIGEPDEWGWFSNEVISVNRGEPGAYQVGRNDTPTFTVSKYGDVYAEGNLEVGGRIISNRKLIPIHSDLNNYKEVGSYTTGSSSNAATLSHCPTSLASTLDVLPGYASGCVIQRLVTYTGIEYLRTYYSYNNIWYDWRRTNTTVVEVPVG